MALTEFQRTVCRIIAAERIAGGESYVAGGAALNEILRGNRVSRDVDLFHDSREAVVAGWNADRSALEAKGLTVRLKREFPSFVEAEVLRGEEGVVLQWAQDSAYRFFPLVEHADFGLTMHPFDLATNKVLALVGRLEVRDWIDVMTCTESLQPFGYLVWAVCGKDPGLNPAFILEQASRSAHYTQEEIDTLEFDGPTPDAAELAVRWRRILGDGSRLVELLPEEHLGTCVTDVSGKLFGQGCDGLKPALDSGNVRFHKGSLRGSWPNVVS